MFRFVFYSNLGHVWEMGMDEVREHLTEAQIEEALQAKRDDPNEEVSYMAQLDIEGIPLSGCIVIEF